MDKVAECGDCKMFRDNAKLDDYGANIVRHADDKQRRHEVEAIFRMMDSDHDGSVHPPRAAG